ncbi:response regulator transcription factor [Paenibacillus sp. FSL W7-1287]|uniref:response regulator transcription factor n=1 Tax=Paenibacillus sp. FSL W7-1287 TaxID=2954538 RepID=UPI0030F8280D
MYKILLADDDYLVLEYLNKMIPWGDLGFEVVGLCEDGQQALNLVAEKQPDVIMTDIGMPHTDGITLIKQVNKEHPKVKSIFLTCFDDFLYAQEAIRLGSFDYILKETMDSESITTMMIRLKSELDKTQFNHKALNNMKFLIKENLTLLRSKLLERLLVGDSRVIADWLKKHEHELELDFTYRNCIPIISFIDDYEELVTSRFSADTLKFAVDNLITETVGRTGKGFCLFHKEDTFFIIYAQDGNVSELDARQAVEDINANLRSYLKLSITSIIGSACTFPEGLSNELNTMLDSSEQRFYLAHGSIAKLNESRFSTHYPLHSMDMNEEVKRLLIREDQVGLQDWVYHWATFISAHQFQPNLVKKWVLSLLLDLEKMLQSLQNFESDSIDSVVHRSIDRSKTAKQLTKRLLDRLSHDVMRMKEINHLPKKTEIMKAQKYVLLNMDKKITLSDVAEHLHLNPSYFSRMFKQHTNMNFVDYVNHMKMEEAKKLLDHTSESVESIADKLGFESKSYFLKVFKKYYGTSPVEYRQGVRIE